MGLSEAVPRRFPIAAALLALVTAVPAASSCSRTIEGRPFAPLTSAGQPLRSDFNRDIGHVRIVMVPAPT